MIRWGHIEVWNCCMNLMWHQVWNVVWHQTGLKIIACLPACSRHCDMSDIFRSPCLVLLLLSCVGRRWPIFFFLRMSISVCVRVHALRTSGLFHCGLTRVHRDPVQEAGSSYEISLPWSVCYANRVLETGTDLEKEVTMSEPSLEQAMP